MRCFIAIDITEELRAELAELQKELAGRVDVRRGDVKWTNPEGIHLTLKFLGEIPDSEIANVCHVVEEVASRHRTFDVAVREVGSFGGRSPRVLWVGAGLGSTELLAVQQDLEEQLERAGWPKEARKFSGHLTLCRIRNVKAGEKLGEVARGYADYDLGSMPAASLCVYESRLTPQGAVYTCLGQYGLL